MFASAVCALGCTFSEREIVAAKVVSHGNSKEVEGENRPHWHVLGCRVSNRWNVTEYLERTAQGEDEPGEHGTT